MLAKIHTMKGVRLSWAFLFLITIFLCDQGDIFASNKPGNLIKQQDERPGFIENKGQIIDQNNKPNPGVLYLLNTPGMNVQLRKGGFSYDLYRYSDIDQGNIRWCTTKCSFKISCIRDSKTGAINFITSYRYRFIKF